VIVVDTNVICSYWIRSPDSALAELALAKDPYWIAPVLWRSEFRNAAALMLRKKFLTKNTAQEIIDQAEAQFTGNEFAVQSRHVIELITQSRCSAYDCEFVALALEQRVPLVTVDRQLLREFPKIAVSLDQFVNS